MSDENQSVATEGFNSDILVRLKALSKRGDIAFALGIVLILVVLIMPMPSWMLDICLAFSITFSVMVLMTVIFIQKPLEFNSFPTVLLISTMIRLALNLASTRLILSEGHQGTDAAGQVIEAFGSFVMGGSYIIGMIVFGILVIVNFVVITKGSVRIAEVSARFSLDAMPGKQMAIDADLSAGLIDETEAKERRQSLEDESSFFGSMDGASKFVRGDAMAGIMITFINIIGGLVIGTVEHDLSLVNAIQTYSLLTIGDGLVSQIPSLIVSTSAGMLVTKSGINGPTDKALFGQLSSYPSALGLSSFLLISLSILPGIPPLPFLFLAGICGYLAYFIPKNKEQNRQDVENEEKEIEREKAESVDVPITENLKIDHVRLELGFSLLKIMQSDKGPHLPDQVRALRKQMATDMGFLMPSIRIQDNMQLEKNDYVIKIKEIEAGRGTVHPDMLLAMESTGQKISLSGIDTFEPTFGMPAKWISQNSREEALFHGYTVVDPPTVISTHITEIVRDNMPELLSYAETKKLLDNLDSDNQRLVSDIIPSHISMTALQRILQNLLRERISIRDLTTILEGVAEASGFTKNILHITEHVRTRLSRQISDSQKNIAGFIPIVVLTPEWEQNFHESLLGPDDDKQLALPPSKLQDFVEKIRHTFEELAKKGEMPVLLTSQAIRPYVRSVIERFRPMTVVMSQSEIHPKAQIKTIGKIEAS